MTRLNESDAGLRIRVSQGSCRIQDLRDQRHGLNGAVAHELNGRSKVASIAKHVGHRDSPRRARGSLSVAGAGAVPRAWAFR